MFDVILDRLFETESVLTQFKVTALFSDRQNVYQSEVFSFKTQNPVSQKKKSTQISRSF